MSESESKDKATALGPQQAGTLQQQPHAESTDKRMNFMQKLAHYAPKPKDIVPNLMTAFQQASQDLAQMPADVDKLIRIAEEAITKCLEADPDKELSLRILVTGKTGQGKSTFINGLLGARFAREGAGATRCTTEVEVFEKEINGVPVVVFDSPGLQDNTSNEEEYIRSMREICQKLSMVLYCTKMTNTRLGDDDKKAMKKLTQAFGQEFWNHAVFVLTFANREQVDRRDDRDTDDPKKEPHPSDKQAWESLEKRRFEGRIQIWEEGLHKFLISEVKVDSSIANGVPVIPTGDHRTTRKNPTPLRLPDRDNWFQVLWETCSFRVKEHGLFLKINSHRMTAVDEGDDGGQQEMSACQGDDLPKEIKDPGRKEEKEVAVNATSPVPAIKQEVPVPVLPSTGSKCEELAAMPPTMEMEKKQDSCELLQMPGSPSVKERRKIFEILQEKQPSPRAKKPRSTSLSTDKQFSLELDKSSSVGVSPVHESKVVLKPQSSRPQPPPKPHHLKSLQSDIRSKEKLRVESKRWSASPVIMSTDELQSGPNEHFCQEVTPTSLPCQEVTPTSLPCQKSTKENIQCKDDSSEKYQEDITLSAPMESVTKVEKAPKEEDETGTQIDIFLCEGPNENTPCEDTPDENIIPKENETGMVKVDIEATNADAENEVSVVVEAAADELLNQPIHISSDFVTKMSIKAVEKKFGRIFAESLKMTLKHVKKPGHWFIKLITKKHSKSIKSN